MQAIIPYDRVSYEEMSARRGDALARREAEGSYFLITDLFIGYSMYLFLYACGPVCNFTE